MDVRVGPSSFGAPLKSAEPELSALSVSGVPKQAETPPLRGSGQLNSHDFSREGHVFFPLLNWDGKSSGDRGGSSALSPLSPEPKSLASLSFFKMQNKTEFD